MDFKQHRLIDWAWIEMFKRKYGPEAYHEYFRKVCNTLSELKPGYQYDLASELKNDSDLFLVHVKDSLGEYVKAQDLDFFIKVCCTWMLSFSDYYFSNDYTLIKRYA